jgi:glycosyltransferase involved in cell wall biosynthesis
LIHDVRQFTQYRKYQNTILTYLYYANLSIQCNIITVSNFTKNEILKLCSKSKNIIVSPNGIKSNTLIDYATPKDIDILYIATFESRKNHLFLIDVIKSITITHPDIKVILIGRDLGTKQKVINKISELKLKKNISIVNKCSQSEIDRFYLRSKVLVNPSKYEGFGMPLLEALSYKINVVCSDILPFKEICGSHCMYCKLDDVLSFKENIIKALCKNPISEDHLKIFQKNYSWVTIALNLFSILNSHLENNSISNYEI